MPLKPITGSSALSGYRYDPKSKVLEVQFTSGGTYRYNNIMPAVVRSVMRAKSKGKMFHKKVKKGGYEYEKIANDPIKKKVEVQGVPIWIEWKKGETRLYKDHKTGEVKYKRLMTADYGYIPETKDADGEEIDVYLGDDYGSKKAFVIKQLKKSDRSFDENKVMIGYPSEKAAKDSYMHHMSACPECFGGIHEVPVTSLMALFGENGSGKEKVLSKAASATPMLFGFATELFRIAR